MHNIHTYVQVHTHILYIPYINYIHTWTHTYCTDNNSLTSGVLEYTSVTGPFLSFNSYITHPCLHHQWQRVCVCVFANLILKLLPGLPLKVVLLQKRLLLLYCLTPFRACHLQSLSHVFKVTAKQLDLLLMWQSVYKCVVSSEIRVWYLFGILLFRSILGTWLYH